MNIHFMFFLLDIGMWVIIANLICSQVYIDKSKRISFRKITIFGVSLLTICFGLFSVLINGIPEAGLSFNSFVYASLLPLGIVAYQQHRQTHKKVLKRNHVKLTRNGVIKYGRN